MADGPPTTPATGPPRTVPPLAALALAALHNALLAGRGPPRLSALPEAAARRLYASLASKLRPVEQVDELFPPVELIRLFYYGHLDHLRVSNASDAFASEAFGGGLTRLTALTLKRPRTTPYGIGHVGVALGRTLLDLTIASRPGLGAAGGALLCAYTCGR